MSPNGTEIQPVAELTVEVKASLATATQSDTRTHVRKVLDALERQRSRSAPPGEQQSTQLPNGVSIGLLPRRNSSKQYEHYKISTCRNWTASASGNGGRRRQILPSFNNIIIHHRRSIMKKSLLLITPARRLGDGIRW